MNQLQFNEFTFMRFEVELNLPGFPADEGKARAAEIKQALLETARDFDIEATVKETTE